MSLRGKLFDVGEHLLHVTERALEIAGLESLELGHCCLLLQSLRGLSHQESQGRTQEVDGHLIEIDQQIKSRKLQVDATRGLRDMI